MPATRPKFYQDIFTQIHNGLTSVVIDLEDAVGDSKVRTAEFLLVEGLLNLYQMLKTESILIDNLPLIFIRVRDLEQFKRNCTQLENGLQLLTGVVLPKFEAGSGNDFLTEVIRLSSKQSPFYAMPILESEKVIKKETSFAEVLLFHLPYVH